MVTPRVNWIPRVASSLRALGPYAAIELLLPGGSLIALSLWAFRHRAELAARLRRPMAEQPAVAAEAAFVKEAA
jgi:hypothetical protein